MLIHTTNEAKYLMDFQAWLLYLTVKIFLIYFFYIFYTVIDLTHTKQDTFSWEIMSRKVYLYVHMKETYFFSFHSCIGFFKEMTHMRQSSSSQILRVSGVINKGNLEWVWVFKQSNSFVG